MSLIFLMEKTNVTSKITDLFPILDTHFNGKINRSRLKLTSIFVIALFKIQTVVFEKHSKAFDSETLSSFSLRRFQRYIPKFILVAELIAKMIFSLLPEKEYLSLYSDCLTADGEFIGYKCIKHLNDKKIISYFHIKKNF